MIRRLVHHVLDSYDTDRDIRRLVNSTEMWFVPVANPDGYDWTFQPDQRMWRKNLRDNNGDGVLEVGDGVDPNRNYPTKWGYDNEGSSDNPASDTYRGTAPASEPETRALDGLMAVGRLRVPDQLPLGRRAAPVRRRLAGGHAHAGRRRVRGDGRRRRRAGRAGLRPRHLGRAVHHQRRDDRARPQRLRHPGVHARDVDLRDGERRPPGRRVEAPGLRERLPLPGRRAAGAGGVREEHPVRPGHRPVGQRPGQPGVGGGPQRPRVRDRPVHRVLRRPPDCVGVGPAGPLGTLDELFDQRRADQEGRPRRVGRRRALRRRAGPLLRRVPQHGHGRPARRQCRGVVHRHQGDAGQRRQRALHLRGGLGHGRPGADHRQRGLHRRQPDLPRRHDGAQVRRRVRGRPRRQRRHATDLGHGRPGGAPPARRAEPLRRRGVGAGRQPAHPGPGGRVHPALPARRRPQRRPGRGRGGAVPDPGGPGLPQRGRQGRPRRRDRAVLRQPRDHDRRHLLRPRRGARGGLRHHDGLLQRLPAAGGRLRPVLPGRLRPGGPARRRAVEGTGRWTASAPSSGGRPSPTTRWTRRARSP